MPICAANWCLFILISSLICLCINRFFMHLKIITQERTPRMPRTIREISRTMARIRSGSRSQSSLWEGSVLGFGQVGISLQQAQEGLGAGAGMETGEGTIFRYPTFPEACATAAMSNRAKHSKTDAFIFNGYNEVIILCSSL